jgi:hypothetical protein
VLVTANDEVILEHTRSEDSLAVRVGDGISICKAQHSPQVVVDATIDRDGRRRPPAFE